jgi:kynurenine formamidase
MKRIPSVTRSLTPVVAVLFLLVLLAIEAPPRAPDAWGQASTGRTAYARTTFDLEAVKLIDLTHPFDKETIYWPAKPQTGFELKNLHHGVGPGNFFYSSNAFCAPEHGGTHLDAPLHFAKNKWATDQIPLDRLIGPAVVIDVRKKAADNPDYRLTVDDIENWEAKHGMIAKGVIVLLRTGWDERWPNRTSYLGDDTPGDASNLHFPSFGAEAAEFLVNQRKVRAIGVDTASIDYGPSKDFPVHRVVAAANVPAFENLRNLDALPDTGAMIFGLPMKIAGGSGGPARVVALVTR